MKYVLVATSVVISGKKFEKKDKKGNPTELDDTKLSPKLLEASYKAGFIKPKGTKAKNPIEVVKQYKAAAEAKAKKEADDKAAAEVNK